MLQDDGEILLARHLEGAVLESLAGRDPSKRLPAGNPQALFLPVEVFARSGRDWSLEDAQLPLGGSATPLPYPSGRPA